MFRSSSSYKKQKQKKASLKTSNSIGSQHGNSKDQAGFSEEKLKLNWVRAEVLEHGLFCGQCAVWGSTVYFKNGGSDEVLEYSCR